MHNFFLDLRNTLLNGLLRNWGTRDIPHRTYSVLAILFIAGLLPMPYGYYISLRTMVCVGLYFFWREVYPVRSHMPGWFYTLIGLFVLYNPIIIIHLDNKPLWIVLNIGTLFVLYRIRYSLKNIR